jgi:hypothetical protein
MKLNDYDLRQKKYTIKELIENIDNLTIKTLLYTQKLTPEFCMKYIINVPKSTEEEYITEEDIMQFKKTVQEDLNDIKINHRGNRR